MLCHGQNCKFFHDISCRNPKQKYYKKFIKSAIAFFSTHKPIYIVFISACHFSKIIQDLTKWHPGNFCNFLTLPVQTKNKVILTVPGKSFTFTLSLYEFPIMGFPEVIFRSRCYVWKELTLVYRSHFL